MSIKTIKNVPQIDLFIDIFRQVGFFSLDIGHTVFFAKFIDCFVIFIDRFVDYIPVLFKKLTVSYLT